MHRLPQIKHEIARAFERTIARVAQAAEGEGDFAARAGRIVGAAFRVVAVDADADRELLREVDDENLFSILVSAAVGVIPACPCDAPDCPPAPALEEAWRERWDLLPPEHRSPATGAAILAALVRPVVDDADEAATVVTSVLRRVAGALALPLADTSAAGGTVSVGPWGS